MAVIILNLYYVTVWLVQRGRNYHTYETEEEVEQEYLYICFGAATALLQVVLSIWFCCTAGGFSYHVSR
ncbi:hypothetical protein Anas_01973 [Armadillidium nasatum]|uniref:Uncharacterized protein n=1 Tax=Armadillidium nasatum TaxID=96803 RepID=A0A5N5TPU6_9CRUS|nr:hypothetical protein Anas_01973 [Armadillidium nasatum]